MQVTRVIGKNIYMKHVIELKGFKLNTNNITQEAFNKEIFL